MADRDFEPRLFPLDFQPAHDVSATVDLFRQMENVKRRPRSPEKQAWLRAQGVDVGLSHRGLERTADEAVKA